MIKLLGIPYDANSSFLKGPALGPPRIRLMETDGSANSFCEFGTEILNGKNYTDLGDMVFAGTNAKAAYSQIKNRIREELQINCKTICFPSAHI